MMDLGYLWCRFGVSALGCLLRSIASFFSFGPFYGGVLFRDGWLGCVVLPCCLFCLGTLSCFYFFRGFSCSFIYILEIVLHLSPPPISFFEPRKNIG